MSQQNEELMKRLKEILRRDREKSPLEATREFLQSYVLDNDWEDIRRAIEHMMKFNPSTVIRGLHGIEDLLADPPKEENTLNYLVACEASWVLDEPNDQNSAIWLRELAEFIRDSMGDKQPPRSS
ncbi:MAG: hypothetical protein HY819_15025 [Acidobacteria bacterium]|nr:hypothetical protein [Acidobacteriota bacterium]